MIFNSLGGGEEAILSQKVRGQRPLGAIMSFNLCKEDVSSSNKVTAFQTQRVEEKSAPAS